MSDFVHPSVQRLLDFARSCTAASDDRVTTFNSLAVRLDISLATLTNWKARGLSKDGALDAEREFGCFATWLLDGTGVASPSSASPHFSVGVPIGEPPPPYLSPEELLTQMGMLLARVPPTLRAPFGDILSGWAASGGADDHRQALVALLSASRKRQA